MQMRFDGQVAVVTASGGGIGRSTAHLLAERGALVVVNDVDFEAAQATVDDITAAGGTAIAEGSAVGTGDFAAVIIDSAMSAFGRLDILVNNAGISRPGPFGEDSDAQIDEVCAVNFMGPYRLMRAVWPIMEAQGGGRIVNTSSSAALGSGMSGAYAPTKAALIGLTKEAAVCGGPLGIRVNAIMPSAFTPLLLKHPDPAFRDWMRRHFPPARVAAVTAWLVSTDSDVNGELFTVGGGLVARLAFLRSEGHCDPYLTPESVLGNVEAILDLSRGAVLGTQKDLQEIYFAAFPRAL